MPRPPDSEDLYRLRVATEPRLSPDGRLAVVVVQTVAQPMARDVSDSDGYRHAIWLVPTDGSAPPRQLTLGSRHDRHPRFSPDGRTLAFLSDRRTMIEDEPPRSEDAARGREDAVQVHLLPMDGGEARRLTDLPRGVQGFEWSPDGTRLVVVSTSHGATYPEDQSRRGLGRKLEPGAPPPSDYRFIDRLDYMRNGAGFTYDQIGHLWLVDIATGAAARLTDGPVADGQPAWAPDGRRIAFTSNRRRNPDLVARQDIHVVDVQSRAVTAVTRGPHSSFGAPVWLPDGETIAAAGHRREGRAGSRNDIWLFAADGSAAAPAGGRNLSARHDLMPGSGMNSDVTHEEETAILPSADGRWLHFSAPVDGAYELWRLALETVRLSG